MRGPCSVKAFRAKVDHLRLVCPPPRRHTVEVRRVPAAQLGDDWADIGNVRRRVTIRLAESLTAAEVDFFLVHEWTHMMCWAPYYPLSGDHDAVWGVWFARIYRAYHGVS